MVVFFVFCLLNIFLFAIIKHMDAIAIITIILAVLTAGGVVFSALFNVKINTFFGRE